jgi:UDP-N-acetylmuramoyl-L-alanine---L-glutamate ligase
LLGGYDRGLDWQACADFLATQPAKGVYLSGANAERIASALSARGIDFAKFASLEQACLAAKAAAVAGDIVLLSPGAPSFDAFVDFKARGRHFQNWYGMD